MNSGLVPESQHRRAIRGPGDHLLPGRDDRVAGRHGVVRAAELPLRSRMTDRNTAFRGGAARTALRVHACCPDRTVRNRRAGLRGHLTAEAALHADLIAAGWARAGERLPWTLSRAGQAATPIGQTGLVTAARAVEGLAAIVFPFAARVATANLDRFSAAIFSILFPGHCRISQLQQCRGANTQGEHTAGTNPTGEKIEATAIHGNPQAKTPTRSMDHGFPSFTTSF